MSANEVALAVSYVGCPGAVAFGRIMHCRHCQSTVPGIASPRCLPRSLSGLDALLSASATSPRTRPNSKIACDDDGNRAVRTRATQAVRTRGADESSRWLPPHLLRDLVERGDTGGGLLGEAAHHALGHRQVLNCALLLLKDELAVQRHVEGRLANLQDGGSNRLVTTGRAEAPVKGGLRTKFAYGSKVAEAKFATATACLAVHAL